MTSAGIACILACFENAEEIFLEADPGHKVRGQQTSSPASLPQMPQLPQPKASACRALTDQEDEFEERAAIIEYEGGSPRPLAEFLARRGRGV
jgi:hypothetical protein